MCYLSNSETLVITNLLFCTHAFAISIVDTGSPTSDTPRANIYSGQWLAAQFTLDQAYKLTDIEGWFYPNSIGGTIEITIYGDNGTSLPDTGSLFYTDAFTFDPSDFGNTNWYGLVGLDWYLAPNTYWVSFENRDSSLAVASMPLHAPSPIINEARRYIDGTGAVNWTEYDELDMGLRIQASSVSIPEPSTMLLLFIGLMSLLKIENKLKIRHGAGS